MGRAARRACRAGGRRHRGLGRGGLRGHVRSLWGREARGDRCGGISRRRPPGSPSSSVCCGSASAGRDRKEAAPLLAGFIATLAANVSRVELDLDLRATKTTTIMAAGSNMHPQRLHRSPPHQPARTVGEGGFWTRQPRHHRHVVGARASSRSASSGWWPRGATADVPGRLQGFIEMFFDFIDGTVRTSFPAAARSSARSP